MKYIAIYKADFSYIEKSNIDSIFSLPGEYYVFKEKEMKKEYSNTYEDPIIFLNEKQTASKLIINDIELTDLKIEFRYNYQAYVTINFYNKIKKTNKEMKNVWTHNNVIQKTLSFIIKTMTEIPENRSWEAFDAMQENIVLKKEIERLKQEIEGIKQEKNKLKAT